MSFTETFTSAYTTIFLEILLLSMVDFVRFIIYMHFFCYFGWTNGLH